MADSKWEVVLSSATAAAGGVAALTCRVSPAPPPALPALFYRGERVLQLDKPSPGSYNIQYITIQYITEGFLNLSSMT